LEEQPALVFEVDLIADNPLRQFLRRGLLDAFLLNEAGNLLDRRVVLHPLTRSAEFMPYGIDG